MAVPKKKVSKARRDKRRAQWKLVLPGMTKCPKCGEYVKTHRVCKACGYYAGEKVLDVESK